MTSITNGQKVTVTIPSLAPGQSVNFGIVTTVIRGGGTIDNTVCMSASNLDSERCTVGSVVASLPQTGEKPWWRTPVLALMMALLASAVVGLYRGVVWLRRRDVSFQKD